MPTKTLILILILAMLAMTGCKGDEIETLSPETVLTQAMQTVNARQTLTPITSPTFTATVLSTPTATATLLTSPTNTLAATAPPPAQTCDLSQFVADISIPDGTQIPANTPFEKIWEIRNTGTCTWNADYRVVFYSGDQMGAPNAQAITTGTVAPGETVKISIQMVAPASAGKKLGNWVLRNDKGSNFGDVFYVDISVVTGTAGTITATLSSTTAVAATSTATSTTVPPTATIETPYP